MSRRRKPDIHAVDEHIARIEYVICRTEGCRNAIAVWAKQLYCSRCRGRKARKPGE